MGNAFKSSICTAPIPTPGAPKIHSTSSLLPVPPGQRPNCSRLALHPACATSGLQEAHTNHTHESLQHAWQGWGPIPAASLHSATKVSHPSHMTACHTPSPRGHTACCPGSLKAAALSRLGVGAAPAQPFLQDERTAHSRTFFKQIPSHIQYQCFTVSSEWGGFSRAWAWCLDISFENLHWGLSCNLV